MVRIAFLGAGNLASAIVRGLLDEKVCAPADIACTSQRGESARTLAAETGITHEPDLARLLGGADTVIVAFKPQSLAAADPHLAELTTGKLVLSVLAGKTLATLAKTFPRARNIVRTMPNTPAAIGASFTPYCSLTPLTLADRTLVGRLLDALGQYLAIEEKYFDALTAVGGSGPAFLFEFVAGLRDAGIAAGPRRCATRSPRPTAPPTPDCRCSPPATSARPSRKPFSPPPGAPGNCPATLNHPFHGIRLAGPGR